MNYLNMAIIWAGIVFHKEVDWHTLVGHNVANLSCKDTMIDTNWTRPNDCMLDWSNRGQFGLPSVVLKDVEVDSSSFDEVNDAFALVTFGKRHKHCDELEDIEYE